MSRNFHSRVEVFIREQIFYVREQNASFILIKREQIFALFASTPFFVREQLQITARVKNSLVV